jgi:pyruvate dehydrogenase E2 component (dihydrolipoamide acetyltransferase)
MPTEIKLPRLGQGMDEGKILKWLKSEGESIAKGEEIYEVETEKVNIEVESPAAGTLLKIVAGEGDTVPIGTVIAWVGDKGDKVPEGAAAGNGKAAAAAKTNGAGASGAPAAAKPAASTPAAAPAAAAATVPAAAPTSGTDRIKASPLARRMAAERSLDLTSVHGTGPDGRIVARDLEGVEPAAAASAPGAPAAAVSVGEGGERIELTSMRRTIARRLTEAWQAPAFYLTINVDMSAANELRARLVKQTTDGDVRPTVSDIITKASAAALRRNPDVNVHWAGDAIIRYAPVHIGMAVATDKGLVVPVIRDAHAKSIREIAADRKRLVDAARASKLQPKDMEGGTFSISNLGMMGIDEFQAVLNPPEAAIIAIGKTADTPVVVSGRVEVRPLMSVTATFDHRAVDGAVGARFLQALQQNLEDPLAML